MIEPLAPTLSGYFHFFGVKGAPAACSSAARDEARAAFDRAIALANTAGRGRPYPQASRPARRGRDLRAPSVKGGWGVPRTEGMQL